MDQLRVLPAEQTAHVEAPGHSSFQMPAAAGGGVTHCCFPCAVTASAPHTEQTGQKESPDLRTWFTLFGLCPPQNLWGKKKQ